MTPKRHAIAKEIIKLLYPGPPFGKEDFLHIGWVVMPPAAPSFPPCRKRRGRKGALGYGWCVLRVRFRQAPIFQSLRTRKLTLRALWYAAHRKKARCPGALGVFRYTLSLCRGGRLCPPTECSVFRESTADSQFPRGPMWASAPTMVHAFRTPPGSESYTRSYRLRWTRAY